MKPKIVLGPYVLRTPASLVLPRREAVPLGISVEWATADQAHQISLLASHENSGGMLRLENILIPADQLPFPVECQLHHVVLTRNGPLLPVEAVLLRLYQTHTGALPIFDLAKELTSVIPIRNTVSYPLKRAGLLIPKVEVHGYRLNTILPHSDGSIVEIVWEPCNGSDPFHVCLCRITTQTQRIKCEWILGRNIGISQLFAKALHQALPGNPARIFSPLGLDMLLSRTQREVVRIPAD
jgi:hypothetical protein